MKRHVTVTHTLIEVPKAHLTEASLMPWSELELHAQSEGWRVQLSNDHLWCRPDHALLRAGRDEVAGMPMLYFQNF